jgi:hypothetical protein
MGIQNVTGKLKLLRVHELGSKFGPPSDQIDVEVVVQFQERQDQFFGFKLRQDSAGPAREGMLGLLRDAFNFGWIVSMDFDRADGRKNGVVIRVSLTKPLSGPVIGGGLGGGTISPSAPAPAGPATAAKPKAAKPAKATKRAKAAKPKAAGKRPGRR